MSAKPSSYVADEPGPFEADKIEQADALAAREPPQQRQAAGVDQCPVHRQPWLGVMPWSRRRPQGEDGRNKRLRSNSTSRARKQHQRRPAPCQRCRLPAPKEGLVGIRIHELNRTIYLWRRSAQVTLPQSLYIAPPNVSGRSGPLQLSFSQAAEPGARQRDAAKLGAGGLAGTSAHPPPSTRPDRHTPQSG